MGRRLAGWALAVFLLFFIATNPTGAVLLARHLSSGVTHLASGLSRFVSALGGAG
jgi:hypothetical protein